MKNTIIPALVTILIFIVGYYIYKKEPDLRYSLSQNIPTKFLSESQMESVQLLELFNDGNEIAEKIRIKINSSITDYDLSRYSVADTFVIENKEDLFELNYPQLPPDGSFKLIIKSKGNGIKEADIAINYNNGTANSLRNEQDFSFWTIFLFFLIIFYTVSLINTVRKWRIESIENIAKGESSYEYPDDVLKRKIPFYISQKGWDKIRKLAIQNYFNDEKKYTVSDFEQSRSFKILNNEKPSYLPEEEWQNISTSAVKQYKENVSKVLGDYFYKERFYKILDIKKPKNFNNNDWNEIVIMINNSFFKHKEDDMGYATSEKIARELKSVKPKIITDYTWDKYINILREKYYYEIVKDLKYESVPFDKLKTFEPDLLSGKERESLNEFCYELSLKKLPNIVKKEGAISFLKLDKPQWMKEEDYNKYYESASNRIEYEKNKDEYLSLLNYVKDFVMYGIKKDFKSSILKNEEVEEIISISEKIKSIKKDEITISNKKSELESLVKKVTKQLEVINDCLENPDVLNRIEDYNNVFATGNFNNLKKIALYNNELNNKIS